MNEQKICYAGFWIRVLAQLTDLVLTVAIFALGSWLFNILNLESVVSLIYKNNVNTVLWQNIFSLLITLGFWKFFSATPGKMVLNLIIVDQNTLKPMSGIKSLIRFLGYIPWLAFIMGFGIWLIFTNNFPDISSKDSIKNFIRFTQTLIMMLGLNFLLFVILSIWMALDKKKQGIHDKIAKTCVIYKPSNNK